MKGFLNYLSGDSVLHKMHPLVKILVSILLCIAVFNSSDCFFLTGLIIINLFLGIIGNGKTNCGLFIRTIKICKNLLKISAFLLILNILIIRNGTVLFRITDTFGITDTAIKTGLIIVLRLTAATLPLSILISVTDMNDLSNTLVKTLHIPYKYAFTFTSTIRFIPIFSKEMAGIIESQKTRGIDFEIKNPIKKISRIIPLCIPLLISSVKKIESTATAAELRGFYLRTGKSCTKKYPVHFYDILFILFGMLLVTMAFIR